MKDLWGRFKAWWTTQDVFDVWENTREAREKERKEREKEWFAACKEQERQELRDRFAMAALTGMLAYPHGVAMPEQIAKRSWDCADAMLKARGDE
jgi:hypothetical protein